MEFYDTEEEQIAALKKWWKENGRAIIVGVVVGVGAIVGWNGWQGYKTGQAREASDLYQKMVIAVREDKGDSAIKLAERIKQNYASTRYAVYADLFLARQKLEAGDIEAAKKALVAVYEGSSDDATRHIARLRYLRLLISEGEYEAALKLISKYDVAASGPFEASYAELKGDANVGLNRDGEARTAYQRALDLGRRSRFLELKNNDLAQSAPPEIAEQ